jgi:hypothetical protein
MVGYTNQENMVGKCGIYILVFGKINNYWVIGFVGSNYMGCKERT